MIGADGRLFLSLSPGVGRGFLFGAATANAVLSNVWPGLLHKGQDQDEQPYQE
jgi:hypothetical protein